MKSLEVIERSLKLAADSVKVDGPQAERGKTHSKLEDLRANAQNVVRDGRAKLRSCAQFNRLFDEYEVNFNSMIFKKICICTVGNFS